MKKPKGPTKAGFSVKDRVIILQRGPLHNKVGKITSINGQRQRAEVQLEGFSRRSNFFLNKLRRL